MTKAILEAYKHGISNFISGFAIGIDLMAAQIVQSLKSSCPGMTLTAAIPFRGQADRFSANDKIVYENLIASAADLTGQANHLGVTIKADIVKQKLPVNNGGFTAIKFGKTNDKVYTELTSEHPIDLCRYQVANGYMGRVGLINSGGESHGSSDLKDAVITAIVNKRAGGMGLISGRKAFQKPMKDGIELLNTIQDVYLDSSITIA